MGRVIGENVCLPAGSPTDSRSRVQSPGARLKTADKRSLAGGTESFMDKWSAQALLSCAAVAVLYIVLNSALNIINRLAFGTYGFSFPLSLTAVHMLCNTICLAPFVLSSGKSKRSHLFAFVIIGLFNVAQIALNNSSLVYIELPLNQAIRATLPIFVAAIRLIQAEPPPLHHMILLLVISFGVHLVVRDLSMAGSEWTGILLVSTSVALQATQMSVAGSLLSEEVSAVEVIWYSSPFAFMAAVGPAAALEGQALMDIVQREPVFAAQVTLGTSLMAVAYNVVMYQTINLLSAVGSAVLGNIKVIMLVLLSKALIGEMQWSRTQNVGAIFTFGGSLLYSVLKLANINTAVRSWVRNSRIVLGVVVLLLVALSGFGLRPMTQLYLDFVPASSGVMLSKTGMDPCRDVMVPPELGNPKAVDGELVLITGGSGFIGSHLAEHLLDLGYRVRVYDNLETGNLQFLNLRHPKLEFHYGDIMDLDALRHAMVDVQGVFHLGAASKVLPSLKNPSMGTFNVERNAVGTSRVMEIANETKVVRKVMYAASSTYYGNQPTPFAETDPFMPTSPYSASKYMGELVMSTNDNLYKLHTLSLRFFMVYGPRNPSQGAYAIVTGKFIGRLKEGLPLMIEGDGANYRDFIHAGDIARALILGYQSDIHGTVINAGSGETHSVREVADLVSSNQQHVPPRKNDLLGTLADTCRAKRELHFQTRHDFVETMKVMIADAKKGKADYLSPMWEEPEVQEKLEGRFSGWKSLSPLERNAKLKGALDENVRFLEDVLLHL